MPSESFAMLDISSTSTARDLLSQAGVLQRGETVESLTVAGPGNMNLVLRVVTNRRSFIVKQSRPWVQKYPSIEAPEDRILAEIDFYRFVEGMGSASNGMPQMLSFDRTLHLLVLEDLGASADYGHVYASQEHGDLPVREASRWLARLHVESSRRMKAGDVDAPRGSDALRKLNHDHIFVIPFRCPRTFDLEAVTPGLGEIAEQISGDRSLVQRISQLGCRYLAATADPTTNGSSSSCLLHGDYYPGSWLHTSGGLRVIDAEFCFVGPIEFDLSVFIAHAWLSGGDEETESAIKTAYFDAWAELSGVGCQLDENLTKEWSAVEILRRLLGVAQLPLPNQLPLKRRLVHQALDWLSAHRA